MPEGSRDILSLLPQSLKPNILEKSIKTAHCAWFDLTNSTKLTANVELLEVRDTGFSVLIRCFNHNLEKYYRFANTNLGNIFIEIDVYIFRVQHIYVNMKIIHPENVSCPIFMLWPMEYTHHTNILCLWNWTHTQVKKKYQTQVTISMLQLLEI